MRLFLIPWRAYSNNNCFHPVSYLNNKDVREASHKIKAIYYIIYRKWNIKKTTWDLDCLDKIQSNEQWTEENCIKVAGSIELLNHMAKYLLKKPSNNKTHQARKEGAGVMTIVFSDLNAENLCSPSLKKNTLKCSSLSLRSIKKSSVTSRLSKILKWLLLFFFPS